MTSPEVVSKGPFQLWDHQTVFRGKWIEGRTVKFRTADGSEGIWESAHRTTKPSTAEVDGVTIVPILKKNGKKFIILVKQFRIPADRYTLEFPAGLVDANETPADTAIREMKEETGYTTSKVLSTSGELLLDPGMTDDSASMVILEIDGDAPENQNPKQELESSESIEVIVVEAENLLEYLKNQPKETAIEACLYSFAVGLKVLS